MNWHIITGSKGGVGKTLLALLLSTHSLDNEESILVFDLNSMNADFSRLLIYDKKQGEGIFIPLEHEQLVLQKTFSLHGGRPDYYVVGWPQNPFKNSNPTHFAYLLSHLKKSAPQIEKSLDIPPLQTIIIDTNYHFCNIFAEQDGIEYDEYKKGILKDDNFNIWFLWVYRQLESLIQLNYDDATLVKITATTIEANLTNKHCPISPFMHVFGPTTLISSKPREENSRRFTSSIARMIYQAISDNKDVCIEELERFSHSSAETGIRFQDWLERLRIAHIAAGKDGDPRHHFLDILVKATHGIGCDPQRPVNVIPLAYYHNDLQYYTDGNYRDVIAELRDFDIYNNFRELISFRQSKKS
jgi:hypothetical protein